MSDIDDLLAQLKMRPKQIDDMELRNALGQLWETFWASKRVAPGHPIHLSEWHALCIDFIRNWDA